MKVSIKDFHVDMPVKNKGVEFEVRSSGGMHLGDVIVSKAGITWCRGRTTRKNGRRLTWGEFADIMEASDAIKEWINE